MENRVLKFTLLYLSQYLFVDDETRTEIIGCYRKLNNISLLKSISPSLFNAVNYTPLNNHYKTAINLCELILRDSSLDIETEGEKRSLSFLIDMEILFQKFIANLLSKRLGEENVLYQRAEYIDINRKLRITPDIELLLDNKIIVIMDTKYKQLEHRNPPSDHVMQVYSYSAGTKTKKCILLYASTIEIERVEYPLIGGVRLFTVHFNLASTLTADFDLNCSKFIDEIMDIIQS